MGVHEPARSPTLAAEGWPTGTADRGGGRRRDDRAAPRAAATLKSPYAARVIDVDKVPSGALYIVMEYLEGESLDVVVDRGRLPVSEAVTYTRWPRAPRQSRRAPSTCGRGLCRLVETPTAKRPPHGTVRRLRGRGVTEQERWLLPEVSMSSPRQAVTLPIVLTLLAACSSVVPQDDPAVTIASPLAKACASYPISVTPGAGAESEVRAGFARIAPGAEVSFASARGTASLVTNVRLSVGSCPRGRNADAQARHLIDGARDAFRLDPSEWTTTFAPTCDQIAAEGTMVSWTRTSLGGAPVRKDVFNYRLRRAGLSVWVDFVSAFYLPPASAALADDMRGCAKLDPVAAEASLRTSQLPFTTFQYCSATGSGKYEPEPRDAFALGAEYWEWEEDAAGAHLRRSREGSLHVDSANHTPQLIASDANCYRDGENRIGFGLRFDAVSSKLEESKPGIDCVVCAH